MFVSAQFTGVCFVGGTGFFFISVALTGLSFGQVSWFRILLGCVAMLLVVPLASRFDIPKQAYVWFQISILAMLNLVVPFFLLSWSQQSIPTGLATMYMSFVPIAAVLFSTILFRVEKLSVVQIIGLLVGIAGIATLLAPWNGSGGADLWGSVACLSAAVSIGFSFAYTRRLLNQISISASFLALLEFCVATVVMLAATPWISLGEARFSLSVVASLVILGLIGTGFGVMWSLNVVQAWGPSRASMSTLLSPAIGLSIGIVFLGESLHWYQALGGTALVLTVPLMNSARHPRPDSDQ